MKIARFLSLSDAKLLFDANAQGTFCMCTQHYYHQLWKNGDRERGDEYESRADFREGSNKMIELANCSFLSCWSLIDDEKNLDWKMLNFKSDVAIVSDSEKVGNFIKGLFKLQLHARTFLFDEGKVNYHGGIEPKAFKEEKAIFMKNMQYERQREYRFVMLYMKPSPIFQKMVFYTSYPGFETDNHFVNFIYFNPELIGSDLEEGKRKDLSNVVTGLIAEGLLRDEIVPQCDAVLKASRPKK